MRRARRLVEVAAYAPLGALATVAAAVGRRSTVAERATPAVTSEPPARAEALAPVPPAAPLPDATTAADELPIDGYDHLAASQVVDRLAALNPDELELVAGYERSHRHRQSVLAKIAQLQG